MPKIYACYIVYNEADKIEISLRSVIDYVDKIIIVDGAFADFPHNCPQSSDETKNIAERICKKKLIWIDCSKENGKYISWDLEAKKRNAYLQLVPIGAWLYIMDADTILTGDVKGTFEMLRKNETINGNDVISLVRILNFSPVLSEGHPLKSPLVFQDVFKVNMENWYDNDKINWIGWYETQFCLYKVFKGMEYRKYHARIYFGDRYYTAKLFYTLPKGPKWSILPNILAINMKFIDSFERYKNGRIFKINTHKKERDGI